ncbi:hypothetical protein IJM86_06120 [bacterium]|nr:hypothetical protein [bacterium]
MEVMTTGSKEHIKTLLATRLEQDVTVKINRKMICGIEQMKEMGTKQIAK